MHKLFNEIRLFREWATMNDKESGEWESWYNLWNVIYSLFADFITGSDFSQWSRENIDEILYILARDNEMEAIADQIAENEALLIFLSEQALLTGEWDAKWQLAARLPNYRDNVIAERLLISFVQDNNEYVNRRALMALATMYSSETEKYCKIAWDRDIYGDLQEYQRMAALHSLFDIKSDLLPQYINLAKKDGRKYLLNKALEIESKLFYSIKSPKNH